MDRYPVVTRSQQRRVRAPFPIITMDAESDRGLAVSAPIDIDRENTKTNMEALSTKNVPKNPCIACQEI